MLCWSVFCSPGFYYFLLLLLNTLPNTKNVHWKVRHAGWKTKYVFWSVFFFFLLNLFKVFSLFATAAHFRSRSTQNGDASFLSFFGIWFRYWKTADPKTALVYKRPLARCFLVYVCVCEWVREREREREREATGSKVRRVRSISRFNSKRVLCKLLSMGRCIVMHLPDSSHSCAGRAGL